MENSVVVDSGGTLRAVAPATPAKPARKLNVKGRVECAILAVAAFLIATAYIVVPLVTALFFMIHTVFAAVSLGVAIVTELALAIIVIIQRTERHRG